MWWPAYTGTFMQRRLLPDRSASTLAWSTIWLLRMQYISDPFLLHGTGSWYRRPDPSANEGYNAAERTMNNLESPNGHHSDSESETASRPINPYLDAVERRYPPEIVNFEMNTDPYANMLPRVSRVVATESEEEELVGRKQQSILMTAVSAILIAVLIVGTLLGVITQLIQ